MKSSAVCTIDGCVSPVRCKGLCNLHYHKLKAARKMKPCACGCGALTAYTFKHGHHTRLFSKEEQSRRAHFNDGSAQRDPPGAKSYRKIHGRHEHRVIAEQMLGRPLAPGEVVHHENGNVRDNAPSNLRVMLQENHIRRHIPEMLAARKAKHGY